MWPTLDRWIVLGSYFCKLLAGFVDPCSLRHKIVCNELSSGIPQRTSSSLDSRQHIILGFIAHELLRDFSLDLLSTCICPSVQ